MNDRRYIARKLGFTFNGHFVQCSPYIEGNGLGLEGLFGDEPFDSLSDLKTQSGFDDAQMKAVLDKAQMLVNARCDDKPHYDLSTQADA